MPITATFRPATFSFSTLCNISYSHCCIFVTNQKSKTLKICLNFQKDYILFYIHFALPFFQATMPWSAMSLRQEQPASTIHCAAAVLLPQSCSKVLSIHLLLLLVLLHKSELVQRVSAAHLSEALLLSRSA